MTQFYICRRDWDITFTLSVPTLLISSKHDFETDDGEALFLYATSSNERSLLLFFLIPGDCLVPGQITDPFINSPMGRKENKVRK